jgi:hypothetical protein
MLKKITTILLFVFIVTIPTISYTYPRCLDNKQIINKKQKKEIKRNIVWIIPEKTEVVTFYYKNKKGEIVFEKTLGVEGGYTLEMKAK